MLESEKEIMRMTSLVKQKQRSKQEELMVKYFHHVKIQHTSETFFVVYVRLMKHISQGNRFNNHKGIVG